MRYKKYTIQQGDTLQSIAQATLGDLTQWYSLASFNGLKFPYIVEPEFKDIKREQLSAGDLLLIPIEESYAQVEDAKSIADRNQVAEYVFGRDLSLITDLDTAKYRAGSDEIVGFDSDGRGSINTVKGYDNIVQSTLMRLNTPIGSLPLHPEYGSHVYEFLGNLNSSIELEVLKSWIEKAIKGDSRISDATVTSYYSEADKVKFNIRIVPISEEDQQTIIINMDSIGKFTLGQ